MKGFIDTMLQRTHRYNLWDFGALKITLIAVGILLGTYFSEFFSAKVIDVWIIFGVTYWFILYKTLVAYRK